MPRKTSQASQSGAQPHVTAAPSKISTVLDLLHRKEGATLAELVNSTGWQPHTARAALTSLRKKGHAIERSQRGGTSSYRINKAR